MSDITIAFHFKWDTKGGANHDFRVGLALTPYELNTGDQIVIGPGYLYVSIPAAELVETGSGTINSDIGEGYAIIDDHGNMRTYELISGSYFTSGSAKIAEFRTGLVKIGGLETLSG